MHYLSAKHLRRSSTEIFIADKLRTEGLTRLFVADKLLTEDLTRLLVADTLLKEDLKIAPTRKQRIFTYVCLELGNFTHHRCGTVNVLFVVAHYNEICLARTHP